MNLDVTLLHLVNATWGWDALAPVMKGLSNPAYFAPVILALVGWLGFREGKRGRAVLLSALLVVAATDQVSSHVLKPWFGRPRPCRAEAGLGFVQTHGARCSGRGSFPSSHAANIAGIMVLLGLRYRKWLVPALLLAFLVGYSRMYLGLHYPSDVLAGWLLGSLFGWGAARLSRFLEERGKGSPPNPVPASVDVSGGHR